MEANNIMGGDRMYRAIIVDDEPLMREGLRTLIDWTGLGFSLEGEAMDAQSALVLALAVRPHLAILDIRMPGVDGTMLARQLKTSLPDLVIIFFSGYKDFTYAHEAIRLQVFRYLLKPLDPQELEQVLGEVATLLDSMRASNTLPAMLQAFIHGQHDAEFLKNLGQMINLPDGELLHALITVGHMAPLDDKAIHILRYDDDTTILLWQSAQQNLPPEIMVLLGDALYQHATADCLATMGASIQSMLAHRNASSTPSTDQSDMTRRLHAYITRHYNANPSLHDFAQSIGFHKGYLGQLIKQETGLSFHAHVANVRFERASYLLRQTNEPVRAVAEAVGIHDVDYFAAQFKRRTGKTPSQFRKRLGEQA